MKRWVMISCGALAALWVPQRASAQSYELTWATIDGGGVTSSSGGGFSLGGTIGQADASGVLRGGIYALRGGFWAIAAQAPELRFFRASTPGARPLDAGVGAASALREPSDGEDASSGPAEPESGVQVTRGPAVVAARSPRPGETPWPRGRPATPGLSRTGDWAVQALLATSAAGCCYGWCDPADTWISRPSGSSK